MTGGPQGTDGLFGLALRTVVVDNEMAAPGGQRLDDCLADPLCPAGDKGDFAGDVHSGP